MLVRLDSNSCPPPLALINLNILLIETSTGRAVTNFSSRRELKNVAGGQKKSGAAAELAGGGGGWVGTGEVWDSKKLPSRILA